MKKHKINVEQVDEGRVILTVNGFSFDFQADEDGMLWQLFKGNELQTEDSFDYDQKHINA